MQCQGKVKKFFGWRKVIRARGINLLPLKRMRTSEGKTYDGAVSRRQGRICNGLQHRNMKEKAPAKITQALENRIYWTMGWQLLWISSSSPMS